MTSPSPNDLRIAAVERETGLSKDTLRVWERRYNFPLPGRDQFGERTYPAAQVEKLRLISNLMDHGERPGKLVGLDAEVLRSMVARASAGIDGAVPLRKERDDLLHYIALCKEHHVEGLRRELTRCLLRLGMYRFVTDVIAPLTTMVGAHWANGHLAVFEEHLYTESVHGIMRNAIASISSPDMRTGTLSRPRILLTTMPHEPHGIGLLMAEAIFALEGAHCISLGVQTPVMQIAQAAKAQAVDIVALSFSVSARSAHVRAALADLHGELAPAVEIWVGGRCPVLARRPPAIVQRLALQEIPAALAEWRRRFPP